MGTGGEEGGWGDSSHDGPERGILDIGCLFFSLSKAPMSWLRMSKLFLLFSQQHRVDQLKDVGGHQCVLLTSSRKSGDAP